MWVHHIRRRRLRGTPNIHTWKRVSSDEPKDTIAHKLRHFFLGEVPARRRCYSEGLLVSIEKRAVISLLNICIVVLIDKRALGIQGIVD